MELLFKREQTPGTVGRVRFKLWAKVDLEDEEAALIKKYSLSDAVLIEAVQPELLRTTILMSVGVFVLVFGFLAFSWSASGGFLLGAIGSFGFGWWYLNEKRETIFVKDVMHGRYFSCKSVIALARKEAWLELVIAYFRQVMETAKHWDGTEHRTIEPLPKDEAREIILRGL